MANAPTNDEEVNSHFKAKNGYGQNGFQGASSDLPGEHTKSGFLPQPDASIIAARGGDHRDTLAHRIGHGKSGTVATAHGMTSKSRDKSDNKSGTVPTVTDRGTQARHPKR